jgi:hypothetical protein
MNRGSSLVPLCLVLASLSCALPTATMDLAPVEPAPAPEPEPSGPRYARVNGVLVLFSDPDASSQRIEVAPGPGTASERLVEVLETGDGWWRVRTLLPREVMAMGLDAGMGFAVLSLEGWVEGRRLTEILSGSVTPSPSSPVFAKPADPLASGPVLFGVQAGTRVHWPDGRVAGEVTEDHYFHAAATKRESQTPEGAVSLYCHERRTAAGLGAVQGWLCSAGVDGKPGASVDESAAVAVDEPMPLPETQVTAKGALDKDIIRRIVRAHINEIRTCYNEGLQKDPQLAGRVAIQFVIKLDGHVGSSVIAESNLADATVAQCIAGVVGTWQFPKPNGGNVIVTYPFNLEPG